MVVVRGGELCSGAPDKAGSPVAWNLNYEQEKGELHGM